MGEEAAIALASVASRPKHLTAVVKACAFDPLLQMIKSTNPAVAYFYGALGLLAMFSRVVACLVYP